MSKKNSKTQTVSNKVTALEDNGAAAEFETREVTESTEVTEAEVDAEVVAEAAREVDAELKTEAQEGFIPVREGSLRDAAVRVMLAHQDEPMETVVPLIAAALNSKIGKARSFYRWMVRNNRAPGVITSTVRAPKVEAEQKAA